ncbi:Isochorismatase hydrolase [Wallemia mellicola]|nr:Isochorismatase hydrolase [Wallemia mellicola]TIB87484.1 Isochorismatase hydrolase [Wallemia mellicola]TIC39973.1 Isochorismatase hydrolase [Wallemia mellicola]TIC48401.1 Isochorismatase hydrolase [Wallemia mellicola]
MPYLFVVDLQYDFINGSLAVNDAELIIPTHLIYHQDAHPSNHISFASRHNKEPFSSITLPDGRIQELWPDHCVANTKGAELHEDIQSSLNSTSNKVIYLEKGTNIDVDAYSAFNASSHNLLHLLKESSTIYVTGLAADFCVKATAIDGQLNGHSITVIEDATKAVSDESNWREKLLKCDIKLIKSTEI